MNRRGAVATVTAVLLSILGIASWQYFFGNVNYYIVSVVFLFLSMLPFFAGFEMKKVTPREITLISTLIALAVVSRGAFYLVPGIKPIAAVIVVSAVCLGAERGYIIGAFSAFVSNFIFGQGYWTPFQMVALGTVGLISGLLFSVVKANRWTMAVSGFILSSAVYGAIVDLSTILIMYGNNINIKSALSVYVSGAPFNFAFGISTAVFLFLFGEPFIKKINRINLKYELIKDAEQYQH